MCVVCVGICVCRVVWGCGMCVQNVCVCVCSEERTEELSRSFLNIKGRNLSQKED